MPANTWQPPQTADRQLNASFAQLADKLDGIDALLASVAVPTVRIARGSVTIADELYVEYRGGNASDVITLPDAAVRGTGRGSLITIQNFGTATVTVRPFSRNSLNDGVAFALAPNTGALCSGNGVSRWTAIKPGGGHIIQGAGVDRPNEGRLNFLSPFTAVDNPGSGSTDVGITVTAGHVIEDEGTPLTQRANMNFVGAGVTAADSSGKTVVTIPGAPASPSLDWGSHLSGNWYCPGFGIPPTSGKLFGNVVATANFRRAVPHVFGRAGTITDLATVGTGQGGGSTKIYVALYRSAADRATPSTRVFSSEHVNTNFAATLVTDSSVGITVSADEVIWFVTNVNGVATVNVSPLSLRAALGTNFTGTGTTTADFLVGYRVSEAYAQPPSTWSGTTPMTAVSDSGSGIPAVMFKFTPS